MNRLKYFEQNSTDFQMPAKTTVWGSQNRTHGHDLAFHMVFAFRSLSDMQDSAHIMMALDIIISFRG